MSDQDFRSPREPWHGYAELGDDERDELLAKKFQQAKDQNDADYALALAAAVANYELVLELQARHDPAETLASHARDLHDDAGSWMAS